MSVHAISWVLKRSTATGSDRLVLIVLANYAGDSGEAWPSHETIAEEARLNVGTVKRSLRSLVKAGEISRAVNAAPDERIPKDRRPNLYVLTGWLAERDGRSVPPADPDRGARSVADGARDLSRTGRADRAPKPSPEPSKEPSLSSEVVKLDPEPEGFAEFYDAYPRHEGRRAAAKAYRAALKRATADEIAEGLARNLPALRSREVKYRKLPATWLNADGWLDETPIEAPAVGRYDVLDRVLGGGQDTGGPAVWAGSVERAEIGGQP